MSGEQVQPRTLFSIQSRAPNASAFSKSVCESTVLGVSIIQHSPVNLRCSRMPDYASQAPVFNTVAYQAGANTQYQYQVVNNVPIRFASNYERMLYLQGKQNQASCGVPKQVLITQTKRNT